MSVFRTGVQTLWVVFSHLVLVDLFLVNGSEVVWRLGTRMGMEI